MFTFSHFHYKYSIYSTIKYGFYRWKGNLYNYLYSNIFFFLFLLVSLNELESCYNTRNVDIMLHDILSLNYLKYSQFLHPIIPYQHPLCQGIYQYLFDKVALFKDRARLQKHFIDLNHVWYLVLNSRHIIEKKASHIKLCQVSNCKFWLVIALCFAGC